MTSRVFWIFMFIFSKIVNVNLFWFNCAINLHFYLLLFYIKYHIIYYFLLIYHLLDYIIIPIIYYIKSSNSFNYFEILSHELSLRALKTPLIDNVSISTVIFKNLNIVIIEGLTPSLFGSMIIKILIAVGSGAQGTTPTKCNLSKVT